jgi:hypothetical protein
MTFNVELPVTTLAALETKAKALGIFTQVYRHEPKVAPETKGLACAIWFERVAPARGGSGLNSTTARIEYTARVYRGMLTEPQRDVEVIMLRAVGMLISALSDDFTLGGVMREVDLLGEFGDPLSAVAGYLTQDKSLFRIVDVTLPIIVNDLWSQAP